MSEPDFEALGRYTAACDRARDLSRGRDMELATLARLAAAARNIGGGAVAARVNFSGLRNALERAADLDIALVEAIADANTYAPNSGKPLLIFR